MNWCEMARTFFHHLTATTPEPKGDFIAGEIGHIQ